MNSNVAFADAARPSRAVILHLMMQPYSIGHELLLTQENNPLLLPHWDFLKLPAQQRKLAVIRAAWICCRTWKENLEKPFGRLFMARWKLYNWQTDYALAIADFQNYRTEGSTFPAVGKPEGDGRLFGSPFLSRLLAFVGVNQIDMPLGMAQWMYFASAEAEGLCKVLNEHEQKVQDELDEIKTNGLKAEEKARIEELMQAAMKERGITCQP